MMATQQANMQDNEIYSDENVTNKNTDQLADTVPRWRKWVDRIWPLVMWVVIWQVLSLIVNQKLLLASPAATLESLIQLVQTVGFWTSIGTSLLRILIGFVSAVVAGVLLAALASRFRFIRLALGPFVQAIKAAPVASFVILILIWVPSRQLSIIISFLMVFPVIYTNMLEGIEQTDANLLEMAHIFHVSPLQRIRYIYVSQALPYFEAACSLSLGLCWKSGIAAEVIGLPSNSIGENLYKAKIYLNTPDLFAWTLVIICISLVFERVFVFLTKILVAKIEGSR